MKMTFQDYINNPIGKNNTVINPIVREATRTAYTNRFNLLLLREHNYINYIMFKDTKHNEYYIAIKIPSETVRKFYYDVVIKFYADAKVKNAGKTLSNYYVQFFSNDPAFNFTYTHTFIKNGIFIEDLLPKASKIAVKEKPKEKNPLELNGYVKTIYFAYLFMQRNGLFNVAKFADAKEYRPQELLSLIEDTDSKIARRIEEGHKKDKKPKRIVSKPEGSDTQFRAAKDAQVVGKSSKVKTITPKAKSMRKSKTIKKF